MNAKNEIDRIKEREAILDKEIADRQKLKDAYHLVLSDLARQSGNGTVERQESDATLFTPRVQPKEKQDGENTRLVRLAISKMTEDYNIRDLYQYLLGHGYL